MQKASAGVSGQTYMSNKITLPISLNPISRRKDKSVKLSLETRELTHTEIMTLMTLEGAEMWMQLVPNENSFDDVPDTPAEVDEKSPSERLKSVLYVWYNQEVKKGKYVGIFDNFRRERMERIIEGVKSKLDEN